MTTPPSDWLGTVTGMAWRLLIVALLLYLAAKLIEAVWPVLVGIGVTALIGFAAWSWYQFRRSRW